MKRTILILLAILLVGWFFAPCFVLNPDANFDCHRSQNNLHLIGIALLSYFDDNGKLPPLVVSSKDGKPLYSWRVVLLPYMDDVELAFDRFRLDEPWDSPNNSKLLENAPHCFVTSFDDGPGMTRYQVLVGPGTAFGLPGQNWTLPNADLQDGMPGPLLVVEANQPVPWSKPADLVYDPNKPMAGFSTLFSEPVHFLCREIGRTPGFNALFADGSVEFIPDQTDETTIRRLVAGNGVKKQELSKMKH
jgi:prepilin-type processing-associated H-X9-DG protein